MLLAGRGCRAAWVVGTMVAMGGLRELRGHGLRTRISSTLLEICIAERVARCATVDLSERRRRAGGHPLGDVLRAMRRGAVVVDGVADRARAVPLRRSGLEDILEPGVGR